MLSILFGIELNYKLHLGWIDWVFSSVQTKVYSWFTQFSETEKQNYGDAKGVSSCTNKLSGQLRCDASNQLQIIQNYGIFKQQQKRWYTKVRMR